MIIEKENSIETWFSAKCFLVKFKPKLSNTSVKKTYFKIKKNYLGDKIYHRNIGPAIIFADGQMQWIKKWFLL